MSCCSWRSPRSRAVGLAAQPEYPAGGRPDWVAAGRRRPRGGRRSPPVVVVKTFACLRGHNSQIRTRRLDGLRVAAMNVTGDRLSVSYVHDDPQRREAFPVGQASLGECAPPWGGSALRTARSAVSTAPAGNNFGVPAHPSSSRPSVPAAQIAARPKPGRPGPTRPEPVEPPPVPPPQPPPVPPPQPVPPRPARPPGPPPEPEPEPPAPPPEPRPQPQPLPPPEPPPEPEPVPRPEPHPEPLPEVSLEAPAANPVEAGQRMGTGCPVSGRTRTLSV
jgi:hypothetical protein